MKKLLIFAMIMALAFGCKKDDGTGSTASTNGNRENNGNDRTTVATPYSTAFDGKAVQLALLLDTSNSMDGLIEQAKGNFWTIINYFAALEKNGDPIELEIALFEYGNDGLSEESGYIRKVLDFSQSLDDISERLFALTTNGGSEYCGAVIDQAVKQLKWKEDNKVFKVVFIAGNEPFNQGKIDYKKICSTAANKNIYVNTIHCGDLQTGINGFWKDGARLGGGKYMIIDHNAAVADITTPYDDQLFYLNTQLNNTYIYYGSEGINYSMKQSTQDSNASQMNSKVMSDRIVSKSTSKYKNSSWDLVDAIENEEVEISEVKEESLPAEYQGLSDAELKKKVEEKSKERAEIQKKIAELAQKRNQYISDKSAEAGVETLDTSIIKAISELGTEKGFVK
ncbi:MAG: VWA domain-containing protein [Spirochaetales bacterium]|nr:VWA domain-containing protein [Spirochaetales bacterium]